MLGDIRSIGELTSQSDAPTVEDRSTSATFLPKAADPAAALRAGPSQE